MSWRRFVVQTLGLAALLALACYGFILVLDPYQNVPFSPDLPRAPVAQNQRYAYPALARNPGFDSAVIGTSMVRLLNPARLDALLGTRFANLAMNSATAYEQLEMNRLFLRHHPEARLLVYAIDDSWCESAETPARYTFRDFPEFMFDENPWNDLLYLFNDKALENAVRMLELLNGKREPKYGPDGYFDFTRDFGPYDLARTRQRIYGGPTPPPAPPPLDLEPRADPAAPRMANLDLLPTLLGAAPPTARVVLLIPPMHVWHQRGKAANYRSCKARVLDIVGAGRPVTVLDYLLDSPVTRDDENYWDAIHYNDGVARRIEADLAAALTDEFQSRADVIQRAKR
jgi:hypothetical protein